MRDRKVKIKDFDLPTAITSHAVFCMRSFKHFKEEAKKHGDREQWVHLTEKQQWRDALESLFRYGILDDYDLSSYTLTFNNGNTYEC